LTLALQGVALTLLAVLFSADTQRESARVGTGDLPRPDSAIAGEIQIPRDLARERLPVPRFPELDEPDENRAPNPDADEPKAPIGAGEKLAALRVSSVALAGLVSMDSPTPIPDAPDVLGAHDISGSPGRSWLGGGGRAIRGTGGLMGPSDIGDDGSGWGGIGRVHGDNCMPGRRGLIRRPPSSGGPGVTTASPGGGSGGSGSRGRPAGGDRPAKSGRKL
jgi:hypothetical protein